jgi:hypothetical protein
LEHLEDIWRRQSVMKTMGLIPDVLTSGEKFDIGPGSQINRRTLLSQFNNSPFNRALACADMWSRRGDLPMYNRGTATYFSCRFSAGPDRHGADMPERLTRTEQMQYMLTQVKEVDLT